MNTDQAIARLLHYFVGLAARPAGVPSLAEGVTAELFVASDGDGGALAGLTLTGESMMFAPADLAGRLDTRADTVTYVPDPFDPRELVFDLEGLTLRLEGYTDATFTPVSCPTIVRVESPADYEHLLEDARRAQDAGVFSDLVLHPIAVIADRCALAGRACAAATGARAFIGPDGVRCGPNGGPPSAERMHGPSCAGCLDASLGADARGALHSGTAFLARYLTVVDALRSLRRRFHGELRVSGFGWRANDALPLSAGEPADAPVLVSAGEISLVVAPATQQVARVGRDVVRVAEILSVFPRLDPVDAVAEHLGVSTGASRGILERLAPLLDALAPAGPDLAGART